MNRLFFLVSLVLITGTKYNPVFSQQMLVVKGNIFNQETGISVVAANVVVKNTSIGTSTSENGNFELKLAPGSYTIRVTSVGFSAKEFSFTILTGNNEFLKIGLLPKKEEIEGVNVYGGYKIMGTDSSINHVPLSVLPGITNILAANIEKQGAVTLTDAMKFVPGGWTETRGRKSKQFFSVRGQKYPYPAYSINGVWQKDFEETAYFLSALQIESIEIVRTGNALVKGLSGITGIIDVKTKKPEKETISLITKYGEQNRYVANFQYENKFDKISFSSGAALFGTNGIPGHGGKERIANLNGNLDWKVGEKLLITAGVTYISGFREFVDIVEPGSPKILNQKEKFDPLHTWLSFFKVNHLGKRGAATEFQGNYTFRNANYQSLNVQQDVLSIHSDKDWEYGLSLLHSLPLGKLNTFRAGALYNHWVSPDGKRYYAGRRCDVLTWSGVIADEQKIGRLQLDAAFRLIGGYLNEWGGFGIEGSSAGFQDVPSIINQPAPLEWQLATGAVFMIPRKTSLHYNFSAGSIAPRNGSITNQGQQPAIETRMQHEWGVRRITETQNEITVSAFYVKRLNAIDLSGETLLAGNNVLVELYENQNKQNYGLEMFVRQYLPRLHSSVFLNATFMKNEKEIHGKMNVDKEIPGIILNAGLLYENAGFDANLFLHYTGHYQNNRFVNPAWIKENGLYSLGDFLTSDITLGYTIQGETRVRFFIEALNLLDVKYETVAGYPDPGRLLQAGIKITVQ